MRPTYIVFYRAPEGAARCPFPGPFHPDRNRYSDPPLVPGACGELDSPRGQLLPDDFTFGWMPGDVPEGSAAQFAGQVLTPALPIPVERLPDCANPPGVVSDCWSTSGSGTSAGVLSGASSIGLGLAGDVAGVQSSAYSWLLAGSQARAEVESGVLLVEPAIAATAGVLSGVATFDPSAAAVASGASSVGPMDLFPLTNGSGTTLVVGQLAGVNGAGSAVLAGAAAALAIPAAGVIVAGGAPGATVTVQTGSLLALPDWTAATGSALLTPGTTYYLANVPGTMITAAPPQSSSLNQPIGYALSPTTLALCLCVPRSQPADVAAGGQVQQAGGILAGQPVASATPLPGWKLAMGGIPNAPAVGIAVAGGAYGTSINVQTEGMFELDDWSAVAASADLTPGALYFLSDVAGQISVTAASGAGYLSQQIGRALTTRILDISFGPPILLSGVDVT